MKDNAKKLAWYGLDKSELNRIQNFNQDYAKFLTKNKTEREVINSTKDILKESGYRNLNNLSELKKGDKIYSINRGRSIIAGIIGDSIEDGFNIIGSHIDSPRLDLKISPFYEDGFFSYFKTHYYGMIKKYQWLTTPLALHGVVYCKNGNILNLKIGEKHKEPVFCIGDLLPHISQKQMKRNVDEVFKAQQLNVINGSIPDYSYQENRIMKNVINIILDKYGLDYKDFISAELQMVPANSVRDVGFDKGLLGGYGHDDRVCAYCSLKALLKLDKSRYSSLISFFDREEIGSTGNTGVKSEFFEKTIAEIIKKYYGKFDILTLYDILEKSKCISGDVIAGYEGKYDDYYDKISTAKIGGGIVITRDNGYNGKEGSSEASAEFIGEIRNIFDDNDIHWQTGEFGKVDEGGGGTISKFLAKRNMDVIDCGPPLLSMHSPFELVSKADVINTFNAFYAFLNR